MHLTIVLLVSMTTVLCDIVLEIGDVYIDGIYDRYPEVDDGKCTDTEPEVYKQEIMAALWTVQKLNDQDYVPGTKIGFRVHQTCSDIESTYQLAYNIASGLSEQGKYNRTLAIIGPESSREAQVVSRLLSALPKEVRPLQVGFSTTAESLSDRLVYSNFFRVIPNDAVQVKAIRSLTKVLDWTYLGLIYQDDVYGNDAASSLMNYANDTSSKFCIPKKFAIDIDETSDKIYEKLKYILTGFQGNHNPPISGFIVVADIKLSTALLRAVRDVVETQSNNTGEAILPSIVFSEAFPIKESLRNEFAKVTEESVVMMPPIPHIPEFTAFWNEHYSGTKMIGLNCDTTCSSTYTNGSDIWQRLFSSYAIQAMMTAVSTIRLVHGDLKCNSSDPCESLAREHKASFIDRMQQISREDVQLSKLSIKDFIGMEFEFPDNGSDIRRSRVDGSLLSDYDVYMKRRCENTNERSCFIKVFEYLNSTNSGNVKETDLQNIRKPQCPDGYMCDTCKTPTNDGIEILEADDNGSDVFIIAICPVHKASGTPMVCGDVKSGGFDVAESLIFGTRKVTEEWFKEWRVGLIVVDSCNDPQVILNRVLNIHYQGISRNGRLQPVQILGYVGGWDSDVTIAVAESLTKLGYIQISYAATSPLLSERNRFPYFMRIIKSDEEQAKQMLDVVRKMGSNLVQILFSDTTYGRGGKDSLVKFAKASGICVSKTVAVDQSTDPDVSEIIKELSTPNSPKLIMVFLSSSDIDKLINQLDELAAYGYKIIASDEFGHRDNISRSTNLKDTITMAIELRPDERLKDHFESLNHEDARKNIWLAEYMQHYFNCYYGWSIDKLSSTRKCIATDQFRVCAGTTKDCFKIARWAPFTRWALEALLRGGYAALRAMCNSTTTICDRFRSSPIEVMQYIRNLTYNYNGLLGKKMFDDNNDGLIGYTIYQIRMENGIPLYRQMDPDEYIYNSSTCALIRNDKCEICFEYSTAKPTTKVSRDEYLQIIAGLIVGFIVLVCILLCINCGRHGKKLVCACEDRAKESEDTYIHPESGSSGYDSPQEAAEASDSGGSLPHPVECSGHVAKHVYLEAV